MKIASSLIGRSVPKTRDIRTTTADGIIGKNEFGEWHSA